MHYKTIVLEMVQENPYLYEKLRSTKMLLSGIEAYAIDLKNSHEQWKAQLSEDNPGSDPRQIASEALEMAILELQERLPSESQTDEAEPLSLDGAMAYPRRHSPPA